MTENPGKLVAEIDSRHVVIPFEGGPALSGVLVGMWRQREIFSKSIDLSHEATNHPERLRHGMAFIVEDGMPRVFGLPTMTCAHPRELDVPAIVSRIAAWPSHARAARLTRGSPKGYREVDPFVFLAWGRPSHLGLMGEAAGDLRIQKGLPDDLWRNQSLAEAETVAAGLVDVRLREAAASHFFGRLSTRSAEIMAYMAERLPFFTWGAFKALHGDVEGRIRAFADENPLLAGRSLSSTAVSDAAASGDMGLALSLSMDRSLVGGWVLKALDRHPDLARLLDGRCRGYVADRALATIRHIPDRHLPRDARAFADYAEACTWMSSVQYGIGIPHPPGQPADRELLPRMKGDWSGTLEACRRASNLRGLALTPGAVGRLFRAMTGHFRNDLMDQAMMLAHGMDGPKLLRQSKGRRNGVSIATDVVAYRGMNVPDRIRHAMRYALAKPRIAALGQLKLKDWEMVVLPHCRGPWIAVAPDVQVRPLAYGSHTTLHAMRAELVASEGASSNQLLLPARTPDGWMTVIYERRRPEMVEFPPGYVREGHHATQRRIAATLANHLVATHSDVGDGLIDAVGMRPEVEILLEASIEERRVHLTTMMHAWGDVLPRRLRRLSWETFADVIQSEVELDTLAEAAG